MPTTCRDIINSALRKLGVVGQGREPSEAQASDALASLQSLYQELVVGGGFGAQRNRVISSSVVAVPGDRILKTAPGVVVTLPTIVNDPQAVGWLWDYGFLHTQPYLVDMSLVTVASTLDTTLQQWIYDAQTARWIDLQSLDLSDPAPLATRGADGLAAWLATRVADEYGSGAQVTPITIQAANGFKMSVSMRLGSPAPVRTEFV